MHNKLYLCLNAGVLPLQNVIEGTPLSIDVVNIQPRWRKGKSLALQDTLTFSVHLPV